MWLFVRGFALIEIRQNTYERILLSAKHETLYKYWLVFDNWIHTLNRERERQ